MPEETPGLRVKIKSLVTRPQLKLEDGKAVYVQFDGKMYKADPITPTRTRREPAEGDAPTSGRKMAPPMLAHVLDLTHKRRPCTMIINAILESELNKAYPNDGYVGKQFQIVKRPLQGKSYAAVDVAEIEVEDDSEQATTSGKAAKK